MITYIEKLGLQTELKRLGFVVSHLDGNPVLETLRGILATAEQETIITDFIAAYDPLLFTQANAVKEIAQYASDLIDKKINPLKAKRLQHESNLSLARQSQGKAGNSKKLDALIEVSTYPEAIYAQYDIEEAAITAQTDWKLIDVEAAKTKLDAVS